MRIVTHTCPDCGAVVAANELEDRRVMRCPGYDCERRLRFGDLPAADREFFLARRDRYRLD